jgi:type VI secretion system protein VasG
MDAEVMNVVGRLNNTCREVLEEAAELCATRTHYSVEVEHFFFKLLEKQNTDVHRLLDRYGVRPAVVTRELTAALDRFKRGNARMPQLSPQLPKLLQEAWSVSSLQLGSAVIRSGATFQALLDHDTLRSLIIESSPALRAVPRETLRTELRDIIRNSVEEGSTATGSDLNDGSEPSALDGLATGGKGKALEQYTVDLTAQARAGRIDPILGRDPEIRQIIDILTRRRQNNPLLAGEAGVGKTAVVEGFAQRVVNGDVPPQLKDVAVRVLDLALLQAGAGVKGEFESRLKSVIAEVKASPTPIILFIDEAHTMIGAGGPAGGGDAANLLKPALARGELRTIAATTWSEYKQHFEKDAALTRRFQVIKVDEPDDGAAIAMLRGVAQALEKHHNVRILDEAIEAAVTLSRRYITGRHLPDKAISVLDTACARVGVGLTGTPAPVEDAVREIELLELEQNVLDREQSSGRDHVERLSEVKTAIEGARNRRTEMEQRWGVEREAVKRIHGLEKALEDARNAPPAAPPLDGVVAPPEPAVVMAPGKKKKAKESAPVVPEAAPETGPLVELKKERAALATLQGETPMVSPCVDTATVGSVISDWTGIPIGRMVTDEIRGVLALEQNLAGRIIGQPQALDAVARRIRTSKAQLDDPNKPVGVFLFVGPSGVGKTETAAALADQMYGGARNMVVVNMSEYQEAHTVSGLKGSPPGYVGYGKGGVLTEAVRRNPYSLILLDEIEKAHPDVLELFYQVFDKGQLEDAEGVLVNFKNTVILLTSNVGTELIMKRCSEPERPDPAELADLVRPALLKTFKPAFLGRMVVVPYYPLRDEELRKIVQLKLARIQSRFRESHHAELTCDEKLIAAIAGRCTEVDSGARNVDAILSHSFLPALSDQVLEWMAKGEPVAGIFASLTRKGGFTFKPTLRA